MPRLRPILLAAIAAATLTASPLRAGESMRMEQAKFSSRGGTLMFLGMGVALPMLLDGKDGKERAWRTADVLLVSYLASDGLKRLFSSQRPDGSDDLSFPSGHTAAAFAIATMQSHYHPKWAPVWYLGAVLIAESRVKLNRHRWSDVIAGAALGYGVARLELKMPRGLALSPILGRDARGRRSIGLEVSGRF